MRITRARALVSIQMIQKCSITPTRTRTSPAKSPRAPPPTTPADGRRRESAWKRSKGPVAWVYRQQTLGRGGGGGASCCRCHCDGPSHVNYTHSCHCFIRTHAHTYTLTTKHTPAHV